MTISIPKPKVPLKGKRYDEINGVRYWLRCPTPEVTGHPIAGEWVKGVWYAIEEDEYVSEGNWHAIVLTALFDKVRYLLRDRPLARAFMDVMVHWHEGTDNPKLAPDLTVLPVVEDPKRKRGSLRLWEEASWPVFVLEVLSESTEIKDFNEKFEVYQERLRVPEYFICDPDPDRQVVWGYRLEGGIYQEIEEGEHGRVWSEQVGGWFGVDEEGMIQVWDSDGVRVPGHEEAVDGFATARQERDAARQELDAAARRAEMAETQLRELQEALQRREPPDAGAPAP